MHGTTNIPHGLLLAAGLLAITVTTLVLVVVWRLDHTRRAIAEVQASCRCCTENEP